jgi:cellulose synthase/poly-beta-1,6-N-acetylglucosamine synthase-like glycosyltransferase
LNLYNVAVIGTLFVLYAWVLYNAPILIAGAKSPRVPSRKNKEKQIPGGKLPLFSIIVPVKNEAKVIGRLMEALLRLNYPADKIEILIVDGGSVDGTLEICKKYAEQYHDQVRLLRRTISNGKPYALNYALNYVKGEIVGVFDADNVPEPDILIRVIRHFEHSSTAAVQGKTYSINTDQNILSKFVSFEEAVAFEIYLHGRDALNLFVPLTGSCYFIRKSVLQKIGGWDDKSLSEDIEISVRLALKGYNTKYAPEVVCWQESSADITQLISQRIRWFRGSMEVALRYGKLVTKPNRKNIDIELTLAGSYIFPLCLFGLMIFLYGFLVPVQLTPIPQVIAKVASLLTLILFSITGIILIYITNLQKTINLRLFPLIYLYWIVESFVATYALIQILLKRPRKWDKTIKTGAISRCQMHLFSSLSQNT